MPTRICHVISGLRRGGAEVSLLRLVQRLDPGRFEHCVVALTGGEVADELRSAGAQVSSLDLSLSRPNSLARLVPVVRGWRPDIVHGWMYHGNLAAILACSGRRRAALLWSIRHSPDSLSDLAFQTRAAVHLGALLSKIPDVVLFNSEAGRQGHLRLGYRPRSATVVYNGFDTDVFRPDAADRRAVRSELGIGNSSVVIGLVARYHPIKDHETFLLAAERIASEYPTVHFVLAGSGVDMSRESLRDRAERIGERRVHLLGARQDIPRLLRAVDIITLTSHAEGLPNVLGEAMATAIPCVSTNVGDARPLLGDTGTVVEVEDVAGIVVAWRQLIQVGEAGRRQVGSRARQRIADCFSARSMARAYDEIYQELASRCARAN